MPLTLSSVVQRHPHGHKEKFDFYSERIEREESLVFFSFSSLKLSSCESKGKVISVTGGNVCARAKKPEKRRKRK